MKKAILSSVFCISLVFTSNTFGHDGGASDEYYVGDHTHHLIVDDNGNCVRTGSWGYGGTTQDCGPKPMAAPVVKAPVVIPPPPRPAPRPMMQTFTLQAGALFDLNSATLKADGKRELDTMAAKIKRVPVVESIAVVGHTCSVGSDAFNQDLSQRRAASVKNYLMNIGIDPRLISASGMGESKPAYSNDTRDGRIKNRRVEVSVRGQDQK